MTTVITTGHGLSSADDVATATTNVVIFEFDQWRNPADSVQRLCGSGWSRSELPTERAA